MCWLKFHVCAQTHKVHKSGILTRWRSDMFLIRLQFRRFAGWAVSTMPNAAPATTDKWPNNWKYSIWFAIGQIQPCLFLSKCVFVDFRFSAPWEFKMATNHKQNIHNSKTDCLCVWALSELIEAFIAAFSSVIQNAWTWFGFFSNRWILIFYNISQFSCAQAACSTFPVSLFQTVIFNG